IGGSLLIPRDDRSSLLVLVVPLRAETYGLGHERRGAIVFVKDPERPTRRSLAAFIEHFGLTPAQAAVANELVKGDGVAAAAARLGISRATARASHPYLPEDRHRTPGRTRSTDAGMV
ncbi:MAG TPA: hypothetical protein VHD59_03035, partial [Pseudolabrys sp.]|nr:hypothetical protein [Pseudolabrys sp.]